MSISSAFPESSLLPSAQVSWVPRDPLGNDTFLDSPLLPFKDKCEELDFKKL